MSREHKPSPDEKEKKYSPLPPDDEEESASELEEFAFFRNLEEREGKPSIGMVGSGCFFILPFLAAITIALFFLLRYMYF